jgi:hypothetical protein
MPVYPSPSTSHTHGSDGRLTMPTFHSVSIVRPISSRFSRSSSFRRSRSLISPMGQRTAEEAQDRRKRTGRGLGLQGSRRGSPDTPVTWLRIPPALLARADELVPLIAATGELVNPVRATVLRLALAEGLRVLRRRYAAVDELARPSCATAVGRAGGPFREPAPAGPSTSVPHRYARLRCRTATLR